MGHSLDAVYADMEGRCMERLGTLRDCQQFIYLRDKF